MEFQRTRQCAGRNWRGEEKSLGSIRNEGKAAR